MKHTLKEEQDALWSLFEDLKPVEIQENKSLPELTDDFIIDKIKDALKESNNNQTQASSCLGIKRTTLIAMCKRLKIF